MSEVKRCARCGEVKPLGEFPTESASANTAETADAQPTRTQPTKGARMRHVNLDVLDAGGVSRELADMLGYDNADARELLAEWERERLTESWATGAA